MKSHTIAIVLEALTASEQRAYNAATVLTREIQSKPEEDGTMTLKTPLQEAKEHALELMHQGHH